MLSIPQEEMKKMLLIQYTEEFNSQIQRASNDISQLLNKPYTMEKFKQLTDAFLVPGNSVIKKNQVDSLLQLKTKILYLFISIFKDSIYQDKKQTSPSKSHKKDSTLIQISPIIKLEFLINQKPIKLQEDSIKIQILKSNFLNNNIKIPESESPWKQNKPQYLKRFMETVENKVDIMVKCEKTLTRGIYNTGSFISQDHNEIKQSPLPITIEKEIFKNFDETNSNQENKHQDNDNSENNIKEFETNQSQDTINAEKMSASEKQSPGEEIIIISSPQNSEKDLEIIETDDWYHIAQSIKNQKQNNGDIFKEYEVINGDENGYGQIQSEIQKEIQSDNGSIQDPGKCTIY